MESYRVNFPVEVRLIWLLSLSIILRFIHVIVYINSTLLFVEQWYSIILIDCYLFIHSPFGLLRLP